MSNEKSRGVDGKKHRKPAFKSGGKSEDGAYKDGFPLQADADQVLLALQCAREDELRQAGLSVVYANCVGNVFSDKDQICQQCGACKRIGQMYDRVGFSHLAALPLGGAAKYAAII